MDCVYTPGPIKSYELMVQHRYVIPFYVMNETLVHTLYLVSIATTYHPPATGLASL